MELSQIVLASASPRRLELLRSIGLHVHVVPSRYDEAPQPHKTPRELALLHAREKAREVASRSAGAVVVGADTVVDLDGAAFGKPPNEHAACTMLHALSGRQHIVHTAFTIIDCATMREEHAVESTRVRFFSLSDREIAEYVGRQESLDKAGAYGIQGFGATLVEGIDGDFYTVMGFPLGGFVRMLARMGFTLASAKESRT